MMYRQRPGQYERKSHDAATENRLPVERVALMSACLFGLALACLADLRLYPWPALLVYAVVLWEVLKRAPHTPPVLLAGALYACVCLGVFYAGRDASVYVAGQGRVMYLWWQGTPVVAIGDGVRFLAWVASVCARVPLAMGAFYFGRNLLNENDPAPLSAVDGSRSLVVVFEQMLEIGRLLRGGRGPTTSSAASRNTQAPVVVLPPVRLYQTGDTEGASVLCGQLDFMTESHWAALLAHARAGGSLSRDGIKALPEFTRSQAQAVKDALPDHARRPGEGGLVATRGFVEWMAARGFETGAAIEDTRGEK